MSIHKIQDRAGVKCGCEYNVHRDGAEEMSKACQEHEIEFIVRHAAALVSCSHANRDLVEP
jgi:hypothetical protein